jgi:hypothetical protein
LDFCVARPPSPLFLDTCYRSSFYSLLGFLFHSHPTELINKMCWLEVLALPQGRDEKENQQANTF